MDVSIIIVNYNTSKLINNCIRSVFKHTEGIDYEIIIVDNASENLSKTIESSSDPRVRLIQLPENVGFGRANNAGSRVANGRNLFFLNPDTILINNAVRILSKYIDIHPECGACGGNLFDENYKPVHSYRMMFPSIYWELNELLNYRLETIIHNGSAEFNHTNLNKRVAYVTGADLMIPQCIFNKVKGFDPSFFMYYEETDLCKRIQQEGYEIHSIPASEIQHLEGKSYEIENRGCSFNDKRWHQMFISRKIYFKKHHNEIYTKICNIILYTTLLIKKLFGNKIHAAIFKEFKSIV